MSARAFNIDEAALLAFADGKLGDAERAEVEQFLATHPVEAAEVAHWQRQNEAMAALYAPVAGEAVPPRLNPHRIAQRQRTERSQSFRFAAAAVVLLALGSSIGWFGRDYLTPTEAASDRLIESALTAHALYVKESAHAVEVAAGVPHLMTWLSNRLDAQINAPDLSAQGFTFVGGRLLPPDQYGDTATPAAQLMYENATNDRLTVYLTGRLNQNGKAYQFANAKGLEAYYWANEKITCTVVSGLPEEEMKLVSKKVYQQLTWLPDPGSRG